MKKNHPKYFGIKEICLIGIFAAVTSVLAQIAIPLPFTPVPVTFGFVAIYTAGIMLKPKCVFFSQITYLLLGTIGLPVFANFKSGPGVLLGPTGGYLLFYPLMALLISFSINLYEKHNGNHTFRFRKYIWVFSVLFISSTFCYLIGTLWLSFVLKISFSKGLALGVYPFIIMDVLKMIFCTASILPIKSRLRLSGII